jgi:hypothetical protein
MINRVALWAVAFAFGLGTALPTSAQAQFSPGIATPALSGSVSATNTTPATIIPSPGAGFRIYVRSVQCARTDTGSAAMYVTLNDAANTVIILPNTGGGGNNPVYVPELVVPVNTPLTFTASTNTASVICNAQAYKLP